MLLLSAAEGVNPGVERGCVAETSRSSFAGRTPSAKCHPARDTAAPGPDGPLGFAIGYHGRPINGIWDNGQSGSFALPALTVGRRCCAAPISISGKMNRIHAPAIRPIPGTRYQSGPNRICADVLPLLGVAFAIAQAVMKATGLKCSRGGKCFRQPVFPETQPSLNGEIQITRRTEQMQMVGHQEKIAHQPGGGRVFPDFVQGALHGRLRQPARAFLGADGEKDPGGTAERNVNAFGRGAATGIAEMDCTHGKFSNAWWADGKGFSWGRASALPYEH